MHPFLFYWHYKLISISLRLNHININDLIYAILDVPNVFLLQQFELFATSQILVLDGESKQVC